MVGYTLQIISAWCPCLKGSSEVPTNVVEALRLKTCSLKEFKFE